MFYQRLSAGTVGITHVQPSSTAATFHLSLDKTDNTSGCFHLRQTVPHKFAFVSVHCKGFVFSLKFEFSATVLRPPLSPVYPDQPSMHGRPHLTDHDDDDGGDDDDHHDNDDDGDGAVFGAEQGN